MPESSSNTPAEAISEQPAEASSNTPERDPIHDELLGECVMPSDILEELLEELPPIPATPPPIPKKVKDDEVVFREAFHGFGRKSVKSTSIVILDDPRRPELYIDRETNLYSSQHLNEAQYNHLAPEIRELIGLLVKLPFVAAVAETDWQNPPKFQLQYTIIADCDEKDAFNAIFADKAFFNRGIKHRALSVELANLSQVLTQNLFKFIDPTDFQNLKEKIEDIIKKLMAADPDSPVYESILKEMAELSEVLPKETPKKIKKLVDAMPPKIKELVDLVNRVEVAHGSEELCMVEFDYPTWELKEAWNYANPYKLIKRRKYRKLLKVIIEQLKQYVPEG